ncbi:Uncharacterised protein [Capnocytophaga ochracea]|uniref:Methylase-associated X1 domain-containing protein n=1 Tax=Capnocytophaga ochracea TaxID=1018 RepID=A0A7Z8YCR2_CAPOC|nr:hypothetical protein [Capnocytophaga ochracea]VDG81773.1 Uncharacterised protein [Capnocytophaga ochracea]
MNTNKIYPETLLLLIKEVMEESTDFLYIKGVQPFLISFKNKEYYIYVKNLSSAYFKDRPDTTRAQLPIKEEFDRIKNSPTPFIFLGYDYTNDVLVCWNFHTVKERLNEKKSVSFYSRQFFQDEVFSGSFLRKRLKNGDEPILFKRKDLIDFFNQVETFFPIGDVSNIEERKSIISEGKLLEITDVDVIAQLKPLIKTKHILKALRVLSDIYGKQFPNMKLKDWQNLIKKINW